MSVPGTIFLFGATGYTGELTAAALVAQGAEPVLVGRSAERLGALASATGGLRTEVADVDRPESLGSLLKRGDVLITTVGPFLRYGATALDAAIAAGAHYLDSSGEAQWIRTVFEDHGPAAARAGVALLPAIGYDYVPGNLAGALALERAGAEATRVDVGYYLTGNAGVSKALSGGTLASAGEALVAPAFARRGGRIVTERGARRVRSFDVDGRPRAAMSIGSSEHLALVRSHTTLEDVNVYLGWFGRLSRVMQATSAINALALQVPGVTTAERRLVRRFLHGSSGGPDEVARAQAGSFIMAQAYDRAGHQISQVEIRGGNGYDFTGEILAWAAIQAADGAVKGTGSLGPVDAFGLRTLEHACHGFGFGEPGRVLD